MRNALRADDRERRTAARQVPAHFLCRQPDGRGCNRHGTTQKQRCQWPGIPCVRAPGLSVFSLPGRLPGIPEAAPGRGPSGKRWPFTEYLWRGADINGLLTPHLHGELLMAWGIEKYLQRARRPFVSGGSGQHRTVLDMASVDELEPGRQVPFPSMTGNHSLRVTVRSLGNHDQSEFLTLVAASADLHHPWMSLPATPQEFQAYLARFEQPGAESLLICLRDTGAIAGRATRPACCSSTAPGETTNAGPSPAP
jgi:hypothetical protein